MTLPVIAMHRNGHTHRRGYGSASAALLLSFFLSALLFTTSMLTASTVMPNSGQERCEGVLRPVDQVVLILVDALRPDFVLSALRRYSRNGGGCVLHPDIPVTSAAEKDYYSGPTLRYMETALRDPTDASLGFFLVADAPTTTAQRLKAIATGTMPAFLEAGSNFNSDATPLDSFVRQASGRAIFLGDDTWTKLFPGQQHWKRTVPIPSFDVADFHTNDDAVLGEIYRILQSETIEAAPPEDPHARLVVAHFLGIDHVGHRINAANREMDRKIAQLNAMLVNVSATLRSRPTRMNTMLLVLGDHGMTQSGDHGGDSPLETDTFLFAQLFRGREQFPKSHQRGDGLLAMTSMTPGSAKLTREMVLARTVEGADPELARLDTCVQAAGVGEARLGSAYQVDVTPTVSLLLGYPIPYSSFGRVLPEVLALADGEADLAAADACNERQIQRYFNETSMAVPARPPWQAETIRTARQRIAAMSYYARRTRTDMHLPGMMAGSFALAACSLSALTMHDVRRIFSRPHNRSVVVVGTVVMLFRWGITFANSFIVYEDVSVFGLFVFYLLYAYVARRVSVPDGKSGGKNTHRPTSALRALLAAPAARVTVPILLVARALRPYLLRHRFHITHAVESESLLDTWLHHYTDSTVSSKALPWVLLRLGSFVGGALWATGEVLAPRGESSIALPSYGKSKTSGSRSYSAPLLALATVLVMAAAYGVPVVHHAAPALLIAVYAATRTHRTITTRGYAYLVCVLWSASLCNEKAAVSVVIAAYGALLPSFVRALHAAHLSFEVQAVLLHLLSYVAFFLEGHQCMLSTIDWNASFVGMPGYSMAMGGALVLTRTFNAFLLPPVACAVVAESNRDQSPRLERSDPDSYDRIAKAESKAAVSSSFRPYLLLVLAVVQATLSTLSAFLQKNHLMLLPIFCPKLIFDVVIGLVTGAGVLLAGL